MAVMSWMRHTSRYFLAAVVITFIASLAYFGATGDRSPAADWVVSVNGETVSAAAFQRQYRALEEQYRQAFRERFTPEMARQLKLQDQAIERAVTDVLLRQRAAREGLSVSDEELSDAITRIGAFQEGGRFSRERYVRLLARSQPPLTPTVFEDDYRGELLRQKVQTVLSDGVKLTEAEVRQRWETERLRVRAAYLLVTPTSALENLAVTDDELSRHLSEHARAFARPERRRALVASLLAGSIPPPVVTEAQVEEAYRARRTEFDQPARARVWHILVRVPTVGGSAAEDQARGRAEQALQQIKGGADFAQVAREASEDTATAGKGGELGFVGKGELTTDLDRAIFALGAGGLGGPVRTPYGYHVLKVGEVTPPSKKELKEVAPTLRATLHAEGTLKALGARAEEVRARLVGAADFAAEARQLGLQVREVGPLGRADAIEGVGRVQEAGEALFALPPSGVSEAIKVPEGYAVFRLLEVQPAQKPEDVKLPEVRTEVLQAVRRQQAQAAAEAKARDLAAAWRKGEDPRALARREGASFAEVGPFSRAEPLSDRGLAGAIGSSALTLPEGRIADPRAAAGGVYVVKTLSRQRPDPAGFEAARTDVQTRLLQEKRSQLFQAWLEGIRSGAKVEINHRVLPAA